MAESCIGPQTNCKPLTYQTALPKKPTFQVIRILRYRKLKISKAHSSAKLLRLREQTRQTNPKSTSTLSHKFSCSVSQESESWSGEEPWSSCGRQIPPSTTHPPSYLTAAAVVHHQKLQPGQDLLLFTSLHCTTAEWTFKRENLQPPRKLYCQPDPNPPPPVRNFGYQGKS